VLKRTVIAMITVCALVATGSAQAHRMHHPPIATMSLTQVEQFQIKALDHYRGVVRRWTRGHRVSSGTPSFPRCKYTNTHVPSFVCWHAAAARWTLRELHETQARIRATAFPPHHALWMCIHNYEARDWHNNDTGGNGHYGGLQMHPGWGYGTSYYASADSQWVQEWSAERGYRASGYSYSWLVGQWAHYDCAARYH